MCGFIGVISDSNLDISKEKEKILFWLRGPDEYKCIQGKFSDYFKNDDDNNLVYQFNRLAILDLSERASQPMVSKKFKTMLMFNGEIFNHSELRNDLENEGLKFETSHSDTEVILNGLSVHGKNFIPKLRGQFAIAFYDSKSKELILARDRLGQALKTSVGGFNKFKFKSIYSKALLKLIIHL